MCQMMLWEIPQCFNPQNPNYAEILQDRYQYKFLRRIFESEGKNGMFGPYLDQDTNKLNFRNYKRQLEKYEHCRAYDILRNYSFSRVTVVL